MSLEHENTPMVEAGPGAGKVIAFTIEELSVGGAESMLLAMANEFVKCGWTVHMVCLTQAGAMASELDTRISLHVLHKQPGFDFTIPFKLCRCISAIDPVVINSHLWVANVWTRIGLYLTRRVVVVTEHSRDTWKPWYYRLADRVLARRTAALVSVSSDTASFYRDTIGLKDSLITVINNGVDTVRFSQGQGQQLRCQWLGEAGHGSEVPATKQLIIGTVGRLVAAKNHKRLIDALVLLKQDAALQDCLIKLVVVGDGPERQSIKAYVDNKGQSEAVVFTGQRHDIPDVLAAFDVFVLSSDREGHPLTALEAQAAGIPVVLTDAGGSREAIAREGEQAGGILVEQSAEALAAAIREMIVSPSLRASRASFAQDHALRHFDKTHMVQRYAALFESVLV